MNGSVHLNITNPNPEHWNLVWLDKTLACFMLTVSVFGGIGNLFSFRYGIRDLKSLTSDFSLRANKMLAIKYPSSRESMLYSTRFENKNR